MDHDAIYRAYPDCKKIDDALGAFKADGSKINLVQSDIDAARTALNSEAAAVLYKFQRKAEYPDWGVQLDYIYHNGIDKWNTDIVDPIKSKYPKPS